MAMEQQIQPQKNGLRVGKQKKQWLRVVKYGG